jgi:signal transduction histidine kinase/ActR/RegA family two-component response regulator
VILVFYWGKIPDVILFVWAGYGLVAATVLWMAAKRFQRQGTESNATQWLKIYAFLVLLQDAPWAMIGPLSYMIENEIYRQLTLFMLAGMTAGAIVTRALIFRIYLISLFSLLTPITLMLLLQRSDLTEGMLALVLVYLMFMLFVAKHYSASINRNIMLWLENERLVGQIKRSHSELEHANHELTREIDYRKGIERELVAAKERSEQANEAKNQFLANVSHELRTPLNGIIGFSELLEDEDQVHIHQCYVSQINKAAHALLHMVNDILDIAAIEAGHVSFHAAPFSLRSEMNDVLAIIRPMATRKTLSLELQIDEKIEDLLRGDANRLRQILSNLLSNAVKYTEQGYVHLTISRLPSESDSEIALRFDVEDSGIGIAATALDTIFDNFVRVENFETRRNEGAGLGLAIVKTLVQKMGGRLYVHSTPGKGSRFSFELVYEHSSALNTKPQAAPPGLTPEQGHSFHVLVVDDNEINRMVLTAFLTKYGIPYQEAKDGYDALKRIRENDFNLVLLDIQMPGISGIDVVARLRAELSTVPTLIAVTAHAFPEQRAAILEAGFSDLLIKPITNEELVKKLTQAYLERQKANVGSKKYMWV